MRLKKKSDKYNIIYLLSGILGLLIVLTIIFHYNKFQKERFENENEDNNDNNGVPKIIHQTAPADKSKWNETWYKCQQSWKDKYPDYEYKMWDDDDLDNFMKTKYEWFYDIYKNYDAHIKRVDSARYFILYEYGGIYADMDFECLKRFDDQLPSDKVSIAESPHRDSETHQNALMCSPKKHEFWVHIFKELEQKKDVKNILASTGPIILNETIAKHSEYVNSLDFNKFAPSKDKFDNEEVHARHHGTAQWMTSELASYL